MQCLILSKTVPVSLFIKVFTREIDIDNDDFSQFIEDQSDVPEIGVQDDDEKSLREEIRVVAPEKRDSGEIED